MNKKNLLFTIIILAVFIGTSILAIDTAKKVVKTNYSYSNNSPDFFIINSIYTKFNPAGNIQNRVESAKITHFSTDNLYLFDKPKMIMYTPNEQPWNITANKGKSEKGKSIVHLWDQVRITRAAGINNPNFDITTSVLTIYPEAKFAQTKQPVTIIQDGNITKSVGAKADFKTGIIKLISKIESVYQIK